MALEKRLLNAALLAASQCGARLFRNNVGVGWVGRITKISSTGLYRLKPGDVVIHSGRPLHAGLGVGSSDLIGWNEHGLFVALEAKTPGVTLTTPQERFLAAVNAAGGIAAEFRDADEIPTLLGKS